MKKLTFLMLLFMFAATSFTQVVVLNYMKVPPGGNMNYEEAEKIALKVHQKRVDEGKMIGWQLYRILNQGTESDYNYVTADVYENLSSSLKGMSMEDIEEILGDGSQETMDKIIASRELIYRETLGYSFGTSMNGDQKYLLVSYMKAKDPEDYYEMERTAYMPLHQMALDKGDMAGWAVWTPWLHDGKLEYTALTVNGYTRLEQMDNFNYGEFVEEFTKDKPEKEVEKLNKMYNKTGKTRSIVKAQIWEKVASTTPKE